MPRLYCAISAHGFGHLAQTAPLLNAVAHRVPDLELTLHTEIPEPLLEHHIELPFNLWSEPADVGMVMVDALRVDVGQSVDAYRRFHQGWDLKVKALARKLLDWQIDLVLSNVAYLPLLAAKEAGLSSVAICSLNWADIYAGCCGAYVDPDLLSAMRTAYQGCDLFLQPAPSMAMSDLPKRRPIAPIISSGCERRAELRARLNLGDDARLVLIGLGGIPTELAFDPNQSPADWHWLVPEAWAISHGQCSAIESLRWPFQDLLRSVDVLVTKPGYGAFAEAACFGVPVIFLERPDWPESPFLTAWLETYGRAVPYVWSTRWPIEIPELVQQLEVMPHPDAPKPVGVDEALGLLLDLVKWA